MYLYTAVFSFLRFFTCVIDTVFCQLDSSATAWRGQVFFQHLLQAVVVKSVCKQRLTYACSDVVYVAETAMCTETKVFSVEYMHGQEKNGHETTVWFMQYAYCSCVISRMGELSRATDSKPQFALCMIHNASCKWPCSGNGRSLFHMIWNISYLQMLHVLACT